jgi:hypothetical protein
LLWDPQCTSYLQRNYRTVKSLWQKSGGYINGSNFRPWRTTRA